MFFPTRFSSPGFGLCAIFLFLHCSSCTPRATAIPPGSANAPMDVALDTANQRMFYRGTAMIPRGFHSEQPFPLKIQLTSWGAPPANNASLQAAVILSKEFDGQARFQPLGGKEGRVSLAGGRIQLRGLIRDGGKELDGYWFLDGLEGGGFRITPRGYLFP